MDSDRLTPLTPLLISCCLGLCWPVFAGTGHHNQSMRGAAKAVPSVRVVKQPISKPHRRHEKAVNQLPHPLATVPSPSAHPADAHVGSATTVQVDTVTTQDLPQTVPSLGSLSSTQHASLSASSDGQITNIYFKSGEDVAQGMPIVQQDDLQQKADLEKAKTDLALAQLKYKRSKQLQNEAISAQQIAALKADVDKAQATKSAAFAALQQRKVSAPFNGTLGAFEVNVGDYVAKGDSLVQLVNNKQLRIDFSVPEIYMSKLQSGQTVSAYSAAYPKQVFIGTVDYVSPLVQPDTRMVPLQALLPNPKGILSPGMFVRVSLQIGALKDVLVVPDQAISADIKGYFVYRVQGSTAKQVYIKLGQRSSDVTQVLSGLKKGDQVVVAGQQKLEDGAQISIKKDH